MMRRSCCALLLSLAVLASACDQPHELILASTTSTVDSGLLDGLIAAFEREHEDVRIKVIAAGSGEAMALGRRGDADILLVHSPAEEQVFMAAGHGVQRLPVMWNEFVIVGPPEDPAGVRGESSAIAALRRIAARDAAFVSRGDSSGTHLRELELWEAAGTTPVTRAEVGQGMGEALTIASERGAYVLSDRGTYLALSENLRLDVLVEGDPRLVNPYHVITVRDSRNAEHARAFAEWLISPRAAALIRAHGAAGSGQPLFIPGADPLRG